MRVIRRDKELLNTTSEGIIRDTQEKVRSIYTKAYAWEAPTSSAYIDTTATMRQHVKRWITEWDLKRLYSDYQPEIEVGELKQDYSEIPEIETPSEGDVDTSNPDNP
jgi:phage gp16-like protein